MLAPDVRQDFFDGDFSLQLTLTPDEVGGSERVVAEKPELPLQPPVRTTAPSGSRTSRAGSNPADEDRTLRRSSAPAVAGKLQRSASTTGLIVPVTGVT